jgi:hypothetical protein
MLVVDLHAVDPECLGAGVKAGHQVPWVAVFLIAGVAEIGADEDGGEVGEFREEVFDDGAAIEFEAVVVEDGGVAGEEAAEVLVADGAGGDALGHILRGDAAVTAAGGVEDVLREDGIAGEVLGAEELSSEINGADGAGLGHGGGV